MSESAVARAYAEIDRLKDRLAFCTEAEADARSELAQVKAGWAEDDARLQRAEEGWAEASERLAQVKAERDRLREQNHAAANERDRREAGMQAQLHAFQNARTDAQDRMKHAAVDWTTDPPSKRPGGWWNYTSINNNNEVIALCKELEDLAAERDTALRHLEAVLEWSNTERFAGRTRHENDAPFKARAFLLSMRDDPSAPA